MFWVVISIAALIVVALTLVGAAMARSNPGTDWQAKEDRPFIGDL